MLCPCMFGGFAEIPIDHSYQDSVTQPAMHRDLQSGSSSSGLETVKGTRRQYILHIDSLGTPRSRYPRLLPCAPRLGDAHEAGNRSCEGGRGFMTRRRERQNEAHSHLGREPLPYSKIYGEDDTADYSWRLKRIGLGLASALFTMCTIGQMESQ
ncbi:unnamed protein product [Pleuronectes platessa]|uniref:Uncharacterized protein n=1 Tax=Pleuronectes platessa TaxID=8262 RepID=A0A9N7U634_PLEPL|nr:unnamed protein product [Pleuronectes platessa]